MELSNRPLLATRTDQSLYLARPLSAEILRAVQQGSNVLILGARGSGKTTELHHLAAMLEGGSVVVVEVDGRLANSALDLLRLIIQRLRLKESSGTNWDSGEISEPLAALEAIGNGLTANHAYVLLDEADSDVAFTMFGRLRDELWQLPITWVVAGNDADEAVYVTPPADAFFERTIQLPGLTVDEVFALLERRGLNTTSFITIEGEVRGESTLEITPREAIELGRLSADGPVTHRMSRELATKAQAMGRPYAMAYSELEALGPVSASDERFLNRLGWTRERATQVLRQLEAEGVVEAFTEPRAKPGRPRKLYRAKRVEYG